MIGRPDLSLKRPDLCLDDHSGTIVEVDGGDRVQVWFNHAGRPLVVELPLAVARQLEIALHHANARKRGGGRDVTPFGP